MASVSPFPSPSSSSSFLAPPIMSRPAPKRLLSLQTTMQRPSPYPSPSLSPAGCSSSSGPKRPGAPKRAHSFCGDSSSSTYALASASASTHLTADKKCLVAPPLERTISSTGTRGNLSPLSQQMPRPYNLAQTPVSTPTVEVPGFVLDRRLLKESTRSNIPPYSAPILTTPPRCGPAPHPKNADSEGQSSPPLPRILVHPVTTPPRPSLATVRVPSYGSAQSSSRSASYASTMSPITPAAMLYGNPIDETEELATYKTPAGDQGGDGDDVMQEVEEVLGRVTELAMC